MDNQSNENASGSSSSSQNLDPFNRLTSVANKTIDPPAPGGTQTPSWLSIPAQADGKYSLQALVDAMATQYPDLPQPTVQELLDIGRSLGFVNPDGSINHNAPIPAGQPSVPTVPYDNTGATFDEQLIETLGGDDNGFHAIINGMRSQMPQHEPPTLAELREIARSLGLGHPLEDFDLAAVLEAWGKKKGLELNLGVKTGRNE